MAQKLRKKNTNVRKVIKKIQPQQAVLMKKDGENKRIFTIPHTEYFGAVGRRKVATARVRVYKEAGDFVVNDRLVSEYFNTVSNADALYNKPFKAIDMLGKFAVTVKVSGSGSSAQLTAVIHGISRALVKMNADWKTLLKAEGLLTRDDRLKETRKIGMGGKARRKRQSPKR